MIPAIKLVNGEFQNAFGQDERIRIPHLLPNNLIIIENPKGSVRYGDNWIQVMNHDYGYIDGTIGADGDEVDVFLGPNLGSDKMFVVDQINPWTGKFDEHKVMLGFNSLDDAKVGYLSNFQQGWSGLRHIHQMRAVDFPDWYKSSLKFL